MKMKIIAEGNFRGEITAGAEYPVSAVLINPTCISGIAVVIDRNDKDDIAVYDLSFFKPKIYHDGQT